MFLLQTFAILCIVMPKIGTSVAVAQSNCNVTDPNTCTAGETFFDPASGCCQNCLTCPYGTATETRCNVTHDTQCVQRLCSDPAAVYIEIDNRCIVDCSRCSYKCIAHENRCECDPSFCYTDEYCQPIPCTTSASKTVSIETPGNLTTLPTWGVAVIAVVAVLGIVAFSSAFLFLGVCTSKKKRGGTDSEASDGSSNVLMTSERGSVSTNSTYLHGYSNHNSLVELLRHANVNSNLSSPRSSPYSIDLTRTEYHLNKLSPVHSLLVNHDNLLPIRTLQVKVDSQPKSTRM